MGRRPVDVQAQLAHNCMLIALDFHLRGTEPEPVAGFRTWLKLGWCVRKGEHGIRIAACVTPEKAELTASPLARDRAAGGAPRQVHDRGGLRQVISCSVRRRRRRPRRARLPAGISLLFVRAPGYVGGAGLSACAVARASRRYPENRGVTSRRRERRRRVPKPGISPTDRSRRKAAALHEVEPGARERSWLHVSGSGCRLGLFGGRSRGCFLCKAGARRCNAGLGQRSGMSPRGRSCFRPNAGVAAAQTHALTAGSTVVAASSTCRGSSPSGQRYTRSQPASA